MANSESNSHRHAIHTISQDTTPSQGQAPGRTLSPQRRECRQATLHPAAQGRPLAEDHPGAVCLGGRPQKGQLHASSVPAPASSPRTQEGHLRRCRLDPDRRLPHAQRPHPLPRSRRRPFPPRITRGSSDPPRQADHQTGVSRARSHQQVWILFSEVTSRLRLWPLALRQTPPDRRRSAAAGR